MIWSDPYRCPVGDLAGALETASCFLLDNGCALEALPLLALWEHVARHVARSLHGTMWCRWAGVWVTGAGRFGMGKNFAF